MFSKRFSRGLSMLLCLLSLFVLVAAPIHGFATETDGNASEVEVIPAQVENLALTHTTPGSTKVVLNWDAVDDAAGYTVRRSTNGGTTWKNLAVAVSTTYSDTGLTAGYTYTYQVAARNNGGTEGPASASAKVDVCQKAPTSPKAAPVSNSASKLTLSWTASEGADSYIVYQYDAATKVYNKAATVDGSATTYTVTGLSANKSYSFKLMATNARGSRYNSSQTAVFKGKTNMAAPKTITSKAVRKANLVKWAAVSGASSYQVYRKTGTGAFALLATTTATQYKDTTAKVNVSYTYRVRAVATENSVKRYGVWSANVTGKWKALSGCIICVDAGHGNTRSLGTVYLAPSSKTRVSGGSTGTRGVYTGVSEASLNLSVAKRLRTALEDKGATVAMVRTSSVCNLNNVERCKVAKKAGAQLTIRLHADGSTNHSTHGVSMQLPSTKYCSSSLVSKSKRAGNYVYKAVLKATGAKAMGQVSRSDLVGFNWASNPTILLEMGFMSNKSEDIKLQTSTYQKKIVSGIVSGTVSYFG